MNFIDDRSHNACNRAAKRYMRSFMVVWSGFKGSTLHKSPVQNAKPFV